MIPVSMIIPLLKSQRVQPEEGAVMAYDLHAALSPEDREYVGALIEHFYTGWDNVMHPTDLWHAPLGRKAVGS